MILILDNYDSFTYNLFQIFLKLNYPIKVVRSDKITIKEIEELNPDYIVLSPGPGTPYDAGICMEVVEKLKGKYPILGICLGHQAILASFGVPIVNASRIVHGKVEKITHNGKGLFRNISEGTMVTRYHSLAGKEKDIPDCFVISAKCDDGEVMAVEHKDYHLCGMQFHPESIGTKEGEKMILNFLHYRRDPINVKSTLRKGLHSDSYSFQDAYDIMDELTEGNMTDSQIGSLLTLIQKRGVTSDELAGFASVLRKKAISFPKPEVNEKRLDTCGTGGSSYKTFNVSTIVGLVANSLGCKVVKHGNRAVTSSSGSADLLEKLGINVDMTIEKSIEVYKKMGLTFLYAKKYHAAMRFASEARSSLGFRTAFNLLGPLSNPAYATNQIIGVYDSSLTETVGKALIMLGVKKAMVVSGLEGYDEISLIGPTKITEINDGWLKSYIFNPESIGVKFAQYEELKGGDVETNKKIAMDIISGHDSPKLDLVSLNAGASLYIYGIVDSIKDGYNMAKEKLISGEVKDTLDKFILLSNS